MAVASTSTQDFNVDELVALALARLGVLNAEHLSDADPHLLALGRKFLFLEQSALKNDGIVLRWKQRYSQPLVTDQAYVDAPADTLTIEEGATVTSAASVGERPILLYTPEDYQRQPDKTITGPLTYYAPEKLTTGLWRVWLFPVPNGSDTQITYSRTRRGADVTTGDVSLDLDPAYYQAVVTYLEYCFARHTRRQDAPSLREDYRSELARAMGDDTEHGDAMMLIPSSPWDY